MDNITIVSKRKGYKYKVIDEEVKTLKRLPKIGGSYVMTIPVQWLRWFCEPDDNGEYWVQFDIAPEQITIKPVKESLNDSDTTD